MNNRSIILIILLSAMLYACQKKAESSAIVYSIDQAESMEAELGSVKYVPLETSDDALVGNIKKMLYQIASSTSSTMLWRAY